MFHSLPSLAAKVQRGMRGGLKNKMVIDVNHELFKKLISGICDIYGDRLISIILYGSVARNTATIGPVTNESSIHKQKRRTLYRPSNEL